MDNNYHVYILTSQNNLVMYIGVTGNLKRRVWEHRQGVIDGFTKRYHVDKLVHWERYQNVKDAIAREKQLKGWNRGKKNALVETMNPEWKDLWFEN